MTNCIYCNSGVEKLTDEHIIPLGLGGRTILKEASCIECNKVTSKFELYILRGHWLGIRNKLKTGTRHKNKPLPPLPANLIMSDGLKILGTVSVEDCIFQLVFSLFEPEVIAVPIEGGIKPYARQIGMVMIGVGGPQNFKTKDGRVLKVFHGQQIEYLLHEFTADNFFRFLSKIAHAYVIKERGSNACTEFYLPEIILGNTKDAMKYIGNAPDTAQGIRINRIDNFHSLQLLEYKDFLTVLIQLFNIPQHDVQPIYQVVVGKL